MKIISALVLALFVAACGSDRISKDQYASSVEFGRVFGEKVRYICTASHIGSGYFLTAAHCANSKIASYLIEGEAAKNILLDKERDVALFKVPALASTPWSRLNCNSSPYVGQTIVMVGEPSGYDDIHSFGRVASAPMEILLWDNVIWVNISGAPGSSGSPIYNNKGEVTAMLVGGLGSWGNLAIAVPSDTICDALVDFKVVR